MKKFIVGLAAGVLCGLGVSAQSTLGGLYQVVTSTTDFATGDTIILVSYDAEENVYAMGTYDSEEENAFHAVNIIGTTTADYLPPTIALDAANTAGEVYEYKVIVNKTKGGALDYVNLQDKDGKYVHADGTSMTLSNTSPGNLDKWVPYIYSDNDNFPYEAVCFQLKGLQQFISYAPPYGFKNYNKPFGSAYYMRAYCYKKIATNETLRIGETGYATMYYGSNDVELPDGTTAYTINVTKEGDKYKLNRSSIGTTVPHGTAVVVKGEPNTDYHPTIYSAAATEAKGLTSVEGNMLHGTDTEEMQSNGDGYYFKLTNHATKGVGFYWGENDGAAFTNKAHKAYLFLPAEMAPASISDIPFSSMEEGGVTLVKEVRSTETQDMTKSVYDLKGRRVDEKGKGLRIQNGKKLIMK